MQIKISRPTEGELWRLTLSDVTNPEQTLLAVNEALRPWADVPGQPKRTRATPTITSGGDIELSPLPTHDAIFHVVLMGNLGGRIGLEDLVKAVVILTSIPGWSGTS